MYKKQLITVALVTLLASACMPHGETISDQRNGVREMHDRVVNDWYEAQPGAERLVNFAAGYAVFDSTKAKIFFAGGGSGYGLAINNSTGAEVFMHTAELSAGIGLGVSDYHTVFIFKEEKTFNDFINNGYIYKADANAVLTSEMMNVDVSDTNANKQLQDDPVIFIITKNGAEVSASIVGSRYWRDKTLNYNN